MTGDQIRFVRNGDSESPSPRMAYGDAIAAAAEVGCSTRLMKRAWRIENLSPDLADRVIAGEISIGAAHRQLQARLMRARLLHGIVLKGFRRERKHEQARQTEAARPDCAARLARWIRACDAVCAIPPGTVISDAAMLEDDALLFAQACIGAAVLGCDVVHLDGPIQLYRP